MPDREYIIGGLESFLCNVKAKKSCEINGIMLSADDVESIVAMLKAQEPIETRLHLCESCKKQYPECDATKDGVVFGSGTGNDNIIGCTAYVNRWKAQESVSPYRDSFLNWRCGYCKTEIDRYEGHKYCPNCGRKVNWE